MVNPGNLTLHIITHHSHKDIRKIRRYLRSFLQEHQSWVISIGGEFLAKKGLDFNTWSTAIVGNFMPMDELALLCIARLWHRHFAVIMKDFVWTTGISIPIDDCCIVFAYCGGVLLRDTVEISQLMKLPLYQTLYGMSEQEHALDLSFLPQNVNMGTSSANVLCVEENKENNKQKPKQKPKKKTKSKDKKKDNSSIKVKPKKQPVRRSTRHVPKPKVKPRTTKTSRKSVCLISLEDIIRSRRQKRRVAPKNLTEPDPVKDALKEQDENVLLSEDGNNRSDHASDYDSPAETEIKTEKGSIKYRNHGLRKKIVKELKIPCPVCEVMKQSDRKLYASQRQLNIHMKAKHPKFKFECSECGEYYSSYNACYKHMVRTHYKKRHICADCAKSFPYPGELKFHMRNHTRKGLLPCTFKGCKKLFTSNKSMFQHLQSHSDKTWECDKCQKTFNTYSNYRQHMKGKHLPPSLKSYCGKMFVWPYQRTSHQMECEDCKKIKKDRDDELVDHPRHLPIRKPKKEQK